MIRTVAAFILTFAMIPMAYAAGGPTLSEVAGEALNEVRQQRVAIINVNHAYISCNFAVPCVYEKMVQLGKDENNALAKEVYSDIIKAINPNLAKFQAFEKQCGLSVPLNQMRAVLVGCTKGFTEDFEQNNSVSDFEQTCLMPNLTKLALEGNMFALERVYSMIPKEQADDIAVKSFPNVSDSALKEYSECIKLLR